MKTRRTTPGTVARNIGGLALLVLLALAMPACLAVNYALQAGAGEFTLLTSARPIEEIRDRGDTPAHLQKLLAAVPQIKQFGESAGLKPTSSYQDFVQLDRPAVVYVVSACPALSLEPKLFHFPIAGAVPYLGWFLKRAAEDFAADLRSEGLDVDLRGASAFSTLGFFHDPLLSSMLVRGPEALGSLANTVLHESVHATLYLAGQTPFNEGLAEVIADRLTINYLAAHGTFLEQRSWADESARRADAERLLHQSAARLEAIYASTMPDSEKRIRKAKELGELSASLGLRRPLNNALLAQHRAYAAGRAGFTHLIEACKGDLRCVFTALRTLTAKSFAKPNQEQIDPLLDALAKSLQEPKK